MSQAKGPGYCHKAMWSFGGDAGCCDEPAYGPAQPGARWPWLPWACPRHGGPTEAEAAEASRTPEGAA